MDGDTRVDALKRKMFLISLPIGVTAAVANLVVRHPTDEILAIDRLVAPIGAVLGFGLWVALLLRPRLLRLVETIAVLSLAVAIVLKYVYTLFLMPPDPAELAGFLPWMLIGFLAPYLVLPTWSAMLASFSLLTLTVVLGLGHAVPAFLHGTEVNELRILGQFFLASGVLVGVMTMYTRIREQYIRTRAVVAAMEELAHTDFLTGLPNRRQLYQALARELDYARRYDRPVSAMLVDIDYFKHVNDTLGHDAGDQVLQEFARALKASLRGADQIGRWGGEEFLILVPETDLDHAHQLAQRLREILQATRFARVGRLTGSFGVAAYRPGDTLESWLKRADEALYRAKQAGRDRVESA